MTEKMQEGRAGDVARGGGISPGHKLRLLGGQVQLSASHLMSPPVSAHPGPPPSLGSRATQQPQTGFTAGALGDDTGEGLDLNQCCLVVEMHEKLDSHFRFR